jgi:hypothetical protein
MKQIPYFAVYIITCREANGNNKHQYHNEVIPIQVPASKEQDSRRAGKVARRMQVDGTPQEQR